MKLIAFNIFFFCLSCLTFNAQITTEQLKIFYKKDQGKELENVFLNLYNQSYTNYNDNKENDTLKIINELFNYVISDIKNNPKVNYFFLQPNYPRVMINDTVYNMPTHFTVSTNSNLRPIQHNYQIMQAIRDFIGDYPDKKNRAYDKMNDDGSIKKSYNIIAKNRIRKYNDRIRFISQYLFIPCTWGKIDNRLVPFEIISVKFNSSLNEALVKYDLVSSGATVELKFVDGNWKKVKTHFEWID